MTTLKTLLLAATLLAGSEPIALAQQHRPNPNGGADRRQNESCRFYKGSDCYAVLNGTIWAETVSFMDPRGEPTKFKKGQSIAHLDQNTNAYAGFKLKRVAFRVVRDAKFHEPKIKVYVNSKKSELPVRSDGGLVSGYEPDSFAAEVNDCPLDFWAVVSNGDVKMYSLTYYWEWPTEAGGGVYPGPIYGGAVPGCVAVGPIVPGPSGYINVALTSTQLVNSLNGIRGTISSSQYGEIIEPLLSLSYTFRDQLAVCGDICAASQARDLIAGYKDKEAAITALGNVPASQRCVDAIRINVLRIEKAYQSQ